MFNPKKASLIREKLEKASKSYYNDSISIISDEEYDNLRDELQRISPNDEFLKKIGYEVSGKQWDKLKHKISMSSLSKVNTIDQFKKWALGLNDDIYISEEKLDGISIDLEYENGVLIKAITRGDGEIGENIFNNVIKMKGVNKKLNDNINCSIRGEIVLKFDDFEKLLEFETLKNPRNAASGIAKRFDGKYSEYLSILVYDIEIDNKYFKYELEKIEYLKKLSFEISPYIKGTIDELCEHYKNYENGLRLKAKYEIDGLVVKCNSIKLQNEQGYSSDNRPKAQIAFKFSSITKISKVIDVKWQVGTTGIITPIIYIEPTNIGGVVVKKMNCHNLEIFNNFKLYKGCKLLFKRSNDVIPVPLEVIDD